MNKNQFVKDTLSPMRNLDNAAIRNSRANPATLIQVVTLDLSTAKTEADPYKIGYPFKTIYVASASDASANANMKLATRNVGAGAVPLYLKDVIEQELPIDGAFLHWSAQSGKTMTLVIFLESSFRSGSQVSSTAGGVSINDGSSFTMGLVTIAAAAATALFATNFNRKVSYVQNILGTSIWVGDASVDNSGAGCGIEIQPGDTFVWRNTAALYVYNVAGGDVVTMEQT